MAGFHVTYYYGGENAEGRPYVGNTGLSLFDHALTGQDAVNILRPAANQLLYRYREFLEANTNDPNAELRGKLAESLQLTEYAFAHDGYISISPQGIHHGKKARRKRSEGYRRAKTGQGRGRKSTHHGYTSATSARDVGYYLEYGTPRMAALHWMETVNEQADDEIQPMIEEAWDQYLTSLGL